MTATETAKKLSAMDIRFRRLRILADLHVPVSTQILRLPIHQMHELQELVSVVHQTDLQGFVENVQKLRKHEETIATCDDTTIEETLMAAVEAAKERLAGVREEIEHLRASEADGSASNSEIIRLIDMEPELEEAEADVSEQVRALQDHKRLLGNRYIHEKHATRLRLELFSIEV